VTQAGVVCAALGLLALSNARAHGSFHGLDENGQRIFVRIPLFTLRIPEAGTV